VFFYNIAKNFAWKSSPLLKLFATMFVFLLLICCVSLPTVMDFGGEEEQSSVVSSRPKAIGYATVTTKIANLRRGSGTDYEICMMPNGEKIQLRQGDEIQVLEDAGDWFKILLDGNETAYIKKTLCSDINYVQSSQSIINDEAETEYHDDIEDNTIESTESIEEQEINEEEVPSADSNTVKLYGAVDKYPITMQLSIYDSVVSGTYYYNKQGPDNVLKLSGNLRGDELELFESDENGNQTGHFKGIFSNGEYYGEFVTAAGNAMQFRLNK
jgi:hypothetical protein